MIPMNPSFIVQVHAAMVKDLGGEMGSTSGRDNSAKQSAAASGITPSPGPSLEPHALSGHQGQQGSSR